MPEMRLFIAIPSNEHMINKLVKLQDKLKQRIANFRWSSPDTFHLTLKFVGEVDLNVVKPICEVTEEIVRKYKSQVLTINSLGTFGSPTNPRVIWAGFDGDIPSITRMAGELDEAMADFGIVPEHKRYHPHLTLGRAKKGIDGATVQNVIAEYSNVVIVEYEVDNVVVFESLLKSGGAEHHPIRTITLK